MPDGRFISKTIAHSEQLAGVSLNADYLFTRCIPHLDREGRMTGNAQLVKAIAVPLRDEITADTIPALLAELADAELIQWYEVEGKQVIQFPGFANHQKGMKKDREAPSRFPPPDGDGKSNIRPASGEGPAKVRSSSVLHPAKVDVSEVEVKSKLSPREVKKASAANGAAVSEEPSRKRTSKGTEARYPHFGKADCDRLYLAWQHLGTPDYGRFRRALAPLFPEKPRYTVDQVEAAITEAIDDATREKESGKPYAFNSLTPETFVQRVDYWVTEAEAPLEVDGIPTAKFHRIMGAA